MTIKPELASLIEHLAAQLEGDATNMVLKARACALTGSLSLEEIDRIRQLAGSVSHSAIHLMAALDVVHHVG
jgi:hypothetical protein